MIQSYKKVLEMESVASLKLEQDKKALEKIRRVLCQDKDFIVDKLIKFLERELKIKYFAYKVIDVDGNIADLLVKENSNMFEKFINGNEYVNFNIEELIDNRIFDNKDDLIIVDLNFNENLLNLAYLCDSLNYKFLSYSKEIIDKLSIFVNYVIYKNIYKK